MAVSKEVADLLLPLKQHLAAVEASVAKVQKEQDDAAKQQEEDESMAGGKGDGGTEAQASGQAQRTKEEAEQEERDFQDELLGKLGVDKADPKRAALAATLGEALAKRFKPNP